VVTAVERGVEAGQYEVLGEWNKGIIIPTITIINQHVHTVTEGEEVGEAEETMMIIRKQISNILN
jgi:hypothetical protein